MRFFSRVVALLSLAGCTVGPDYVQPEVHMPAGWNATADGGAVAGSPIVADWWTTLGDAQLVDLIRRAADRNQDVRIAAARVREARAGRRIAGADALPSVDAATGYQGYRLSEDGPFARSAPPGASREGELYLAGFDASWEIDVFGAVRRSVEAADADLAAAADRRRDVLVSVLAEVARNYAELRGAQRRLEIARHNLDVQRSTLELTRSVRAAGRATDIEVLRAEAFVTDTEAIVPALEFEIARATHRLGVLLGESPGALRNDLGAAAIPAPPPRVPLGLPSQLLERRPDIRAAERELAAATARVGAATADLFPRFFLTGIAGFQGRSGGSLFDEESAFWTLGPSLHWPLFQGGRIRANIAAQSARAEAAGLRYEQAVLRALEETETALVGFGREQDRRDKLEHSLASLRQAVDLARERYRAGLESFEAVLDTERSMLATEERLAQSATLVTVHLIALYKALGGGWSEFEAAAEHVVG